MEAARDVVSKTHNLPSRSPAGGRPEGSGSGSGGPAISIENPCILPDRRQFSLSSAVSAGNVVRATGAAPANLTLTRSTPGRPPRPTTPVQAYLGSRKRLGLLPRPKISGAARREIQVVPSVMSGGSGRNHRMEVVVIDDREPTAAPRVSGRDGSAHTAI